MIYTEQRHNHHRFYWLFAALFTAIFIRYAFQVNIPRVTFLIFIALIAALGDEDEILGILLCCIPLHEFVDFYYSVVICIAVFVVKFPGKVRINLSFVPVFLMVIWELLHCFGEPFSPKQFICSFIPLIAIMVLLCSDVSALNYGFLIRTLATATTILCITILWKVIFLADFDVLRAIANLQRLGLETEDTKNLLEISGSVNPNSLGIICILSSVGLMQLRTLQQKKKMDMFLVILLLVFGTLTASRTFLACLVAAFALLLLGQRGSLSQKLRFAGTVCVILIVALVVLTFVFPELMTYFLSRFQGKDLTTGRLRLMDDYHRFITSSPWVLFFGVGFQNFAEKLLVVYRVTVHMPHNGIQELILAWGLPGLLMFSALLIVMVLRSRRFNRSPCLLNYIPLIILLFKSQAGQMLASPYTMLGFAYAYLSLTQPMHIPQSTDHT